VGDAQTVRINGNKVTATLVKIADPAPKPTFTAAGSDADASARIVGVEMTFTNKSQKPEPIGLVEPTTSVSNTEFNVTGQLSGGSDNESFNNYGTGFGGCTATPASNNLAPGATATYCVLLKVKSGDKAIEIDWNSIDTDNDQATWGFPDRHRARP
jgi:hypothetical protein